MTQTFDDDNDAEENPDFMPESVQVCPLNKTEIADEGDKEPNLQYLL